MQKELYIYIISNITLEPYFEELLIEYFMKSSISIKIEYLELDEYITKQYNEVRGNSSIYLVWLNFEVLFPDIWNQQYTEKVILSDVIKQVVGFCEGIKKILIERKHSPCMWVLFEDYYNSNNFIFGNIVFLDGLIDKINQTIYEYFHDEMVLLDMKRIIAEIGINQAYNKKSKYRWNAPYSKKMVDRMACEVNKQYLIECGITPKCLVLDCDNVLWGGGLPDCGIENIVLAESGKGKMYQDFQRYLLSLYYQGVILTICSKNDEKDILEVFHNHSGMILKEEHIAFWRVNWDNKANNIISIASNLNLDFERIVFVDDEPAEISAVKALLPNIRTILYQQENIYEELSCFNLKPNIILTELYNRVNTYKTNVFRDDLKYQCKSKQEYLELLKTRILIQRANESEFRRISELTQRTNKFTIGKRYTVSELKKRYSIKDNKLYAVYAKDVFSDLGLIGAMEIENDVLTLFCLSCRALGRDIENEMMRYVESYEVNKVRFCLTKRNEDILNLFYSKYPYIEVAFMDK